MPRVAFLSATCMIAGHPDQRPDQYEFDLEFFPMRDACQARGIELQVEIWDDPNFDARAYDAVMVGTTWDYTRRPDAFLRRLREIEASVPLFNPLTTVQWNMNKAYLKDLAERGASTVPTLWRPSADAATIASAFDELHADEIVVKPVVGAGAWRQARLRRGEPLPPADKLPLGACMIQPFLAAVCEEGEISMIAFDRRVSHAVRKVPARGDYRVQAMYGAHELVHEPTREELQTAEAVLQAVQGPLLYARVDLLRDDHGNSRLMELELIEPYLYPEQGPGFGVRFAEALERLLGEALAKGRR